MVERGCNLFKDCPNLYFTTILCVKKFCKQGELHTVSTKQIRDCIRRYLRPLAKSGMLAIGCIEISYFDRLYVTSTGTITFFVRKRIHGKDERIILGNFPDMTVENARKEALKAKAEVADGKNPNEEKQRLRQDITFGEMFTQFMERYSKPFKRSWQYDEREINKFLPHWFKKKASLISKQEIQRLHESIHNNNGLYQANRILERIRAIYNKAIEWGWEGVNPTLGIKKFKEKSRDRFLQFRVRTH